MNYYVYKLGAGHVEYMARGGASGDLNLLFPAETTTRDDTAQSFATQERCMRHFLAHETRSRIQSVIYQAVPCHDDVVIGFVEDAPEGWAAMYVSSPVPLPHLDVAWFATLTLHPSEELEVLHRDGRSRPVIDVQRSVVYQPNPLVKERNRRRAIL